MGELITKPWAYNPKIVGFIQGTVIKAGPRFLNQVPTLNPKPKSLNFTAALWSFLTCFVQTDKGIKKKHLLPD